MMRAYLFPVLMFATGQMVGQTPIDKAISDITGVIVHDVFNAPAASRIYAYTAIAAYEATRWAEDSLPSLCDHLQQMPCMRAPDDLDISDYGLAGAYAAYFTAKAFVFSEDLLMQKCTTALGESFDTTSDAYIYARFIADAVVDWSKTDGYADSRKLPRYTIKPERQAWEPTPPDYADAIEPHWGSLRMFVRGADTLHSIPPMPVFDTLPGGFWHAQALHVMEIQQALTPGQELIVKFWDDNPFTLIERGHLHYAQKRVSPAGHWMDITRTALDSVHASPATRAQAYAWVSIAMADAFISGWRSKYVYETLRPETYINRYLDAGWRPYLQSPPFPEYPSGHSMISAAASTILTSLFGASFDFTDASETMYDLPARTFTSFEAAADEAGISRIYGGIHFLPAITTGKEHGNRIAHHQLKVLGR